jgi:hypothetical protein
MGNWFVRALLVISALSPMLGAVAVAEIASGKNWHSWVPWLAPAVVFVFICWILLLWCGRELQRTSVTLSAVERSDKEVLSFLLAYLLPVISAKETNLEIQWMTTLYVFIILILVFTHACALHFNPVLGLLGYHFYAVKDEACRPLLLISREDAHHKDQKMTVAYISRSVVLYLPEKT